MISFSHSVEATRVASSQNERSSTSIIEMCEKQNEYIIVEESFAVALRDAKYEVL